MDTIVPQSIPQDKLYYVYTLAYPESMGGHVFYVGKGSSSTFHDRIDNHELEARSTRMYNKKNISKITIIRKIWDAGEEIVKTKVAFFANEQESYIYEWGLINMTSYAEQLTNENRFMCISPVDTKNYTRIHTSTGFSPSEPYRHASSLKCWGCFVSPKGKIHHEITDIYAFSRRNKIPISSAIDLANGKRNSIYGKDGGKEGKWKRSPTCPDKTISYIELIQ